METLQEIKKITFDQAVKLRSIGFHPSFQELATQYTDGWTADGIETSVISSTHQLVYFKVPLALVLKWLWDEKKVWIHVDYKSHSMPRVFTTRAFFCGRYEREYLGGSGIYTDPEEALSKAIDVVIEKLQKDWKNDDGKL